MVRPEDITELEDRIRLGMRTIADTAELGDPTVDDGPSVEVEPAPADQWHQRDTWTVVVALAIVVALLGIIVAVSGPSEEAAAPPPATRVELPGDVPRFVLTAVPNGQRPASDVVREGPVHEPGFVSVWTTPVPTRSGPDRRLSVTVGVPGQAYESRPSKSTAVKDPPTVDINGNRAVVLAGEGDRGITTVDWETTDGTEVVVAGTGLSADETTTAAKAVQLEPAPGAAPGSGPGMQVRRDLKTMPGRFTNRVDGRSMVFHQPAAGQETAFRGERDGDLVVRTIAHPFVADELRWAIDQPVREFDGADGLHFIVTDRPDPSSPDLAPTIYGGRGDVTIKISGVPMRDLLRVAQGLREDRGGTSGTTLPASGSTTAGSAPTATR